MGSEESMIASSSSEAEEYEPPALVVLGSLPEMTLGRTTKKSDGINPGSLIGR